MELSYDNTTLKVQNAGLFVINPTGFQEIPMIASSYVTNTYSDWESTGPYETVEIDFDEQAVLGMIKTFRDDATLCRTILSQCYLYPQFDSYDDCMEYMESIPMVKPGYCPLLKGNTKACRWTHMILTNSDLRPEKHCYHVGPNL